MPDEIQVTISQESVKQIIQAKVQAAVAEALRPNADRFVEEIVRTALLVKSSAEEYRYANEDKKPSVLGHLIHQMIRQETQKAINEWVEENRPFLAKKLRESLRKNVGWANRLTEQLLTSLVSADTYKFKVDVTPIQRKEEE